MTDDNNYWLSDRHIRAYIKSERDEGLSDEAIAGHCRKKIEEYLPHPMTEEEIETAVASVVKAQRIKPGEVREVRQAIIDSQGGDPENVEMYRRVIRELEGNRNVRVAIGRKAELEASDFLQAQLGQRADVITRGGHGRPDLEVVLRSPKGLKEFVAVKSTMELGVGRPSVTYSNLDKCPEAEAAKAHNRKSFYLLVKDRNARKWCILRVPVGTDRMKVSAADFDRFAIPRKFGK